MKRDDDVIEQINTLWVPVYPFMADHVLKVSGVASGYVLDLGPFAGGLAVSLLVKSSGFRAKVMDESERVLRWAAQQARENGCSSRLTVQTRFDDFTAGVDDVEVLSQQRLGGRRGSDISYVDVQAVLREQTFVRRNPHRSKGAAERRIVCAQCRRVSRPAIERRADEKSKRA